ncbi:MAG: sugar transferase [Chloroflexi bacterium]|nr:sugar transferase [Chloroflexota bacterium]
MISTTLTREPARRRAYSRNAQYRIFLTALFITDVAAVSAAFALAFILRFQTFWIWFAEDADLGRESHIAIAGILLPAWLMVFVLSDLYNPHYLFSSTQEYKKAFNACSVAFTVVVVVTFLIPYVRVSRGWIVAAWLAAVVLVLLGRFLMRRLSYVLRARHWLTARTLIVGTDSEARAVAQQLLSWPGCGADVIGFVDNFSVPGTKIEGDVPVVGALDHLPALVEKMEIDELIVSPSALAREDVLWIFQTFGTSGEVELRFSPGLFEIFTSGVSVKEIGAVPLVSMRKVRLDAIESAVKAVSDYGIAILALILNIPLLVTVALLIKFTSPGPIFHKRRVLGRGGKEFYALKFRTMYMNGDEILARHPDLQRELAQNQKLKDDPRITRIGKFLRRYSIDESPQLFNVLMGQMSVVGPRMIAPTEMEKYGKWRTNLLTVKPGITGLWQISGRSDLSYAERVRLDMYYIRNYTAWADIRIIWRTLSVVLSGKGAY